MKKYSKPHINTDHFRSKQELSNLNAWLQGNGLTEAGITTYLIHS